MAILTVTVTKDMVDLAARLVEEGGLIATQCPNTLGVRKALGLDLEAGDDQVWTGHEGFTIYDDDCGVPARYVELPQAARRLRRWFDREDDEEEPAWPVTYQLEVPD